MENFLKKFSDVPNGFIEDFFNISKEEYNDFEKIINFNTVVKWLGVRKDNLKELLVKKFEEKYDYEIIQMKYKRSSGKTHEEKIMLSPDTFKELCMISQTAKAKDVRKYFLSVEKLVKKYYADIQEKLYKQLDLLKTNQKPKVNVKGGVVYIIRAQNSNVENIGKDLYKLGKTENIKKRLKTYNSGNANDIEPLFMLKVDNVASVEDCIKNLMRDNQYRKYKEIYEVDLDIIKKACVYCDALINGFNEFLKHSKKSDIDRKFKRLLVDQNGIYVLIQKNNVKNKKVSA